MTALMFCLVIFCSLIIKKRSNVVNASPFIQRDFITTPTHNKGQPLLQVEQVPWSSSKKEEIMSTIVHSVNKLTFFYDVISPYSWIALEIMMRYRQRWNLDIKLCPVFLGGLLRETGNTGPALLPSKAKYIPIDVERMGLFTGVPVKQPADFHKTLVEKGTLQAQRFLTAVDLANPLLTETVSRELWKRIWSLDQDITQAESLEQAALASNLPEPLTKNVLSQYTQQPIKEKLKVTTEEAAKCGAFGVPTFIVQKDGKDHLFFGSDRFELLAWFLGKHWEGPLRNLGECQH